MKVQVALFLGLMLVLPEQMDNGDAEVCHLVKQRVREQPRHESIIVDDLVDRQSFLDTCP
jgi:hypothetical protein